MGARPSSFKAVEVEVVQAPIWSKSQRNIFDWFSQAPHFHTAEEHLIVRARAGTGKTTTIVEGVNRAPEESILVTAFNKGIADTLNSKITNSRAEAKTLHGVGMRAIGRMWRGLRVAKPTSARADFLTDKVVPSGTPYQMKKLVSLLHTKGREMCPTEPTPPALMKLALFFNLEPSEGWAPKYTVDDIATWAAMAMLYAKANPPRYEVGIDFADMIYLPLAWDLLTKDYQLVVVDEAQDMSKAQLEIVRRVCDGRLCIVGDDRQAIYSFRGADTGSLDRLKKELGALELPLTTTYRCGRAIVARAKLLVPDFEAGPNNPEGEVVDLDHETMMKMVAPGDFVLSRLNAPLVSLTLRLLRSGVRARMAGRDIGAGILSILKRCKVESFTPISQALDAIDRWERKMTTRYASFGELQLVDQTHDQADMLRALMEDADDMKAVMANCDYLFTDDPDASQVVCSSVHKAKGLEADRVFILWDSLYRRGPSQEEDNICYVATTRAISYLGIVRGTPSLQRRTV